MRCCNLAGGTLQREQIRFFLVDGEAFFDGTRHLAGHVVKVTKQTPPEAPALQNPSRAPQILRCVPPRTAFQ